MSTAAYRLESIFSDVREPLGSPWVFSSAHSCVARASQSCICSPSRLPPCFWSRVRAPFQSSLPPPFLLSIPYPARRGRKEKMSRSWITCSLAGDGLRRALGFGAHIRMQSYGSAATTPCSSSTSRSVLSSSARCVWCMQGQVAGIHCSMRLAAACEATPTLAACAVSDLVAFAPPPPASSLRIESLSSSTSSFLVLRLSTLSCLPVPLSTLLHAKESIRFLFVAGNRASHASWTQILPRSAALEARRGGCFRGMRTAFPS
ncbi:hypothetical protein K438DRAFT_945226 [Mycena galopus ATCC 62051]|nr:hypothetical protein K438DRAFT_945226 [Mycena galopus ATCC 62051]